MRFHRNYGQLQLWPGATALAAHARVENLVAARLEPVIRQLLGHTTLDIVFRAGAGYLTVPAVIVDSPQVVWREQDRFVWPAPFAAAVEDRCGFEIEQFLFPWLRSVTLGRSLNAERIRHFGSAADREVFEAARSAGFVGAAPLVKSVNALAPYVFGGRYAIGKNAIVAGANDGVQGAVYLERLANTVSVASVDEDALRLGAQWFSWSARESEFGMFQVAFVGAGQSADQRRVARGAAEIFVDPMENAPGVRRISAAAYPLDILFTWDTMHAPEARSFNLAVPETPVPERPYIPQPHTAAGGSAGRIIFGLRRDWETARDSDVDTALELARLLRDEGFTVDITGESARVDFAGYDVAHWFNLIEAPSAASFLMKAKAAGLRTVATAMFTDVSGDQRQWGTETNPVCFKQEIDEASVGSYLSFVKRRALLAPDWEDEHLRRGPIPDYDVLVRETLQICDVVIAESLPEAELLGAFGFDRDLRIIPPFVPTQVASAARAPIFNGRFALLPGAIEPRNNQLFAVRGALDADFPLVLAGPIRDLDYAFRLREASDDRIICLDPTSSELDWLYACADICVNFAWYDYGTAALWRAMLSGARVAASGSGWGPTLWQGQLATIDPAVPGTLTEALTSARTPSDDYRGLLSEQAAPTNLLRNVLAAYTGSAVEAAGA